MYLKLQEYHRPSAVEEAVALLTRHSPVTRALAGGTSINGGINPDVEALVDLSGLGLGGVEQGRIGAMATLQAIADAAAVPQCLREAALASAPRTIRAAATLGGTLHAADGGIAVPAALQALGARRIEQGPLLLEVTFDLPVRSSFAKASRTPSDAPIVCAAACLLTQKRVRVAVAGVGPQPLVFEGEPSLLLTPEQRADDIVRIFDPFPVLSDWMASAEYRQEAGRALVRRAVLELYGGGSP